MSEAIRAGRAGNPETAPDCIVRQFNPDLHPPAEIARLHLAVRQLEQQSGENNWHDITDSQTDLSDIDNFYIKPGGQFFVAADEAGRISGFVGIKKLGQGLGELKRLAVDPGRRGLGIGSRLVDQAIYWAIIAGYQKLQLSTGYGEEAAHKIYYRYRFRETGRDEANQDILMELNL